MIIDIAHKLSFSPGSAGARMVEHLLLTPLNGPTQTIKAWKIETPGIDSAAAFADAYGNRAHLVTQAHAEEEIVISVTGRVETRDRNGVLGRMLGEPVMGLFRRTTALTMPDDRVLEPFRETEQSGNGRIALLHAIMGRLGELYRFAGGEDAADATPPAEAMQSQAQEGQSQSQGIGSAEPAEPAEPDTRPVAEAATFAHGFIGAVRSFGIPARYVTGYVAGEDGGPSMFHAWAEAHDDGLGWIAFDPTLGYCPTDRHVRVAVGLDALSTAPLRVVPQLSKAPGETVEITAAEQ